MERIQRILSHPQYKQWLAAGEQKEQDRIFCRHDMIHCLDVARIAYILWLEQQGDSGMKPLFYAAALLHDVGKWQNTQDASLGHGAISAAFAKELLPQWGFSEEEQDIIIAAILFHSGTECLQEIAAKKEKSFSDVFYLADKLSRPCWACNAKGQCYWTVKNEGLTY